MAEYSSLICLLVGCLMVNVESSAFTCPTEGRFPVPGDCGSYVDCFLDSDSEMITRVGYCWGFPYSPDKKQCVTNDEMPGCIPVSSMNTRLSQVPVPGLNFHCTGTGSEVGCHHCYLGYTCIGGHAFVNMCKEEESCSTNSQFSGTCLPEDLVAWTESDCACDSVSVFGDFYNQTYYHFCDSNQDIRDTTQCPNGQTFNEGSGNCETTTTPTPPATPSCTSSGTKVNPSNCQHYYTCLPDGSIRTGSCGNGEYFNQANTTCLDSCSFIEPTPTPTEICPGVGVYRDPTDCTKFNICLVKDVLHKAEQCPSGTYFSGDAGSGSCVSGSLPAECSSFEYSQCPGYEALVCP